MKKKKSNSKDKIKLPKSLKIGYKTYQVREMTHAEHMEDKALGECKHDEGVIVVSLERGDKQEQSNTLLHEVLHACYKVANIQDEDEEERIVHAMTNVLLQVLKDNKMEGINS